MNRRTQFIIATLCSILLLVSFNNCSGSFKTLADGAAVLNSATGDLISQPPAPPPVPAPVPNNAQKVDVFVASGHMGRTLMSCDDGKTWINDRSDSEVKCLGAVDCDHTPFSATGLDIGDGWIFRQNGWGANGVVSKSRDGKNWLPIKSGGWGGGLAYAKGALVQIWEGSWGRSTDMGTTFTQLKTEEYDHVFISRVGEKFFLLGRPGGPKKLGISTDQGLTWSYPTAGDYQPGWGSFAEGNGVIVSTGFTYGQNGGPNVGYSARSTDNGLTWTTQTLFSGEGRMWAGPLFFNGTHFVSWSMGEMYKSADGLTWEKIPIVLNFPLYWQTIMEFNKKTGTYVAILHVYNGDYERQQAYRSTDGINWTTLDTQSFPGGHPILQIRVGELDASACAK